MKLINVDAFRHGGGVPGVDTGRASLEPDIGVVGIEVDSSPIGVERPVCVVKERESADHTASGVGCWA